MTFFIAHCIDRYFKRFQQRLGIFLDRRRFPALSASSALCRICFAVSALILLDENLSRPGSCCPG